MNLDILSSFCKENGILLSDKSIFQLCLFENQLLEKNKVLNLTSITENDQVTLKHFVDSLFILKYIDINEGSKCIDVGCGGGFPGMPLLICRPYLKFTFLDSKQKKLNFINDFLKSTELNGTILHGRAEELAHEVNYREKFDFCFSRAVADQDIASELCIPYLKIDALYISMKTDEREIIKSKDKINLLGGDIQDVYKYSLPSGDRRCLGIIRKIKSTPDIYPRKMKEIKSGII